MGSSGFMVFLYQEGVHLPIAETSRGNKGFNKLPVAPGAYNDNFKDHPLDTIGRLINNINRLKDGE